MLGISAMPLILHPVIVFGVVSGALPVVARARAGPGPGVEVGVTVPTLAEP